MAPLRDALLVGARSLVAVDPLSLGPRFWSSPPWRLPSGAAVPTEEGPALPDLPAGLRTELQICKIMYTSVRSGDMGVSWATDYPRRHRSRDPPSGRGTSQQGQRDGTRTTGWFDDRRCPVRARSAPAPTLALWGFQVRKPRGCVISSQGGFLWVDDFWDPGLGTCWSRSTSASVPVSLTSPRPSHSADDVSGPRASQVTNIQFWRRSAASSSERGADSAQADFRAIATTEAGSWSS